MRLYPFREAMALGLGLLRLPPQAFWQMTPRELDAAVDGLTGRAFRQPPATTDLAALMRRYPDNAMEDAGHDR